MDFLSVWLTGLICFSISNLVSAAVLKQEQDESTLQTATPLQFPYAVAIKGESSVCTGSILSPSVILTSASCIFPMREYPSDIKVYTTNAKMPPLEVKTLKIHPAYRIYPELDITSADIALISLTEKITIDGAWVDVIHLPTRNLIRKPDAHISDNPLLASWPAQEYNEVLAPLTYTETSVLKQSVCDKIWNSLLGIHLDTDMICTEKRVPCELVGGSGLKILGSGGKPYIIAVSSGFGNCSATNPSVLTRIGPHVEWIKIAMKAG